MSSAPRKSESGAMLPGQPHSEPRSSVVSHWERAAALDEEQVREQARTRFVLARVASSALLFLVTAALGANFGPAAAGAIVLAVALLPRQRISAVATELGAVLGWVLYHPNPARWGLVVLGALALALLVAVRAVRGRPPCTEPRSWGLGAGLVAVPVAALVPLPHIGTAMGWLVLSGWVLAAGLALSTEGFTPLRSFGRWGPQSVRERALGRGSVGRNVLAAAVATGVDFFVFRTLLGWISPALATLVGCLLGGVLNFSINQRWAFETQRPLRAAAMRYLWVSAASAAFNSVAVAVIVLDPTVSPIAAWAVARVLGFLGWNYPMQRDHVFAHSHRSAARYESAAFLLSASSRHKRRAGR